MWADWLERKGFDSVRGEREGIKACCLVCMSGPQAERYDGKAAARSLFVLLRD